MRGLSKFHDHQNNSIPSMPRYLWVDLSSDFNIRIFPQNWKLKIDIADAKIVKSEKNAKDSYFLWLLDVHTVGQAAGVSEEVFKDTFYTCAECGRYMTQRVSFSHHDDSDDWESSVLEDLQCIYLRGKTKTELGGLCTSNIGEKVRPPKFFTFIFTQI